MSQALMTENALVFERGTKALFLLSLKTVRSESGFVIVAIEIILNT